MNSKTVGAKIVKLRKERAYTQAALAERLNVSNKTVSRWETGDGFPEISLLPKLAAELGISVDELLSENDIEKTPKMPSSEKQTKKQSELSALAKLFTAIGIYEIFSLLLILSKAALAKSKYFNTASILTAVGGIQVTAWILLIILLCRLYLRLKTQASDKAALITAIWSAAFFILGIYQAAMRLVFIGSLGLEVSDIVLEPNPVTPLFAVKILKYISLCVCVFITSKTLNEARLRRFSIFFIIVIAAALILQITALCLGKGYAVTADTAVLYLLYSIFVILSAKANKTAFAHIHVD